EESHQVASLRMKDAKLKRNAAIVLISPTWSELDRFATAVLRTRPGQEATVAQALSDGAPAPAGIDGAQWEAALAAMNGAKSDVASRATVIFAPEDHFGAYAGQIAAAATNLAITLRGESAPEHLLYLPTDANVRGAHDAGLTPGAGGKSFAEIVAGAQSGAIKAVILHADNPLLTSPGTAEVTAALKAL